MELVIILLKAAVTNTVASLKQVCALIGCTCFLNSVLILKQFKQDLPLQFHCPLVCNLPARSQNLSASTKILSQNDFDKPYRQERSSYEGIQGWAVPGSYKSQEPSKTSSWLLKLSFLKFIRNKASRHHFLMHHMSGTSQITSQCCLKEPLLDLEFFLLAVLKVKVIHNLVNIIHG